MRSKSRQAEQAAQAGSFRELVGAGAVKLETKTSSGARACAE